MSEYRNPANAPGGLLDPLASLIKNPFGKNVSQQNKAERGVDFKDGFQIIEYVRGQPQKPILLNGNLMPMIPFKWGNDQRIAKEYYPGNPEAVAHVIGLKFGPVTIHGRFKDKRYKDPSLYGVSYQYARLIEDLQRRGNLLKFGMQGERGSWFRYGFLERTDFELEKLSKVDYSMTFFVVSDKLPINNFFTSNDNVSPSAANTNLIAKADSFRLTYSAIPSSMPQSLADKLNGLINSIATPISAVTGFISGVLQTGTDLATVASRALGLIKNARASLSVYRRTVDNIAHTFQNFSTTAANDAKATVNAFRNFAHISESMKATHQLSGYLAQLQAQFEAISKTLPIGRYKVQQGDTIQRISIKYYGTADNWESILNHNQLHSTVLVPGTVLEIPKV